MRGDRLAGGLPRLLLASLLLYSTLSGSRGQQAAAADEVSLVLPADRGSIPRRQGTRVLLKSPAPAQRTGTAELASFQDKVFIAWSTVSEKPPHSTTTWLASSRDGTAWSEPRELGADTNEAYLTYWLRESGQVRQKRPYQLLLEPRTFHVAKGRLYLWARAAIDGTGRDAAAFFLPPTACRGRNSHPTSSIASSSIASSANPRSASATTPATEVSLSSTTDACWQHVSAKLVPSGSSVRPSREI